MGPASLYASNLQGLGSCFWMTSNFELLSLGSHSLIFIIRYNHQLLNKNKIILYQGM